MDDLNNITKPIEPPKVKFLDKLKYRFALSGKKSKVVTTVIGVALMAGVSFYVSYASLTRRNVSLNTDNKIGAANPSCYLELALKTPTPTPPPNLQCGATCPSGGNTCAAGMTCFNGVCRNPSCTSSANCICPTSTPVASNICSVTYNPVGHQGVCSSTSQPISYTIRFDSLPSSNPPYYLITDWYIGAPVSTTTTHHYVVSSSPIVVGQTYTISGIWPGLDAYPNASEVDVSVSFNVQDKNGNLVPQQYNCSGDKNFFWTPYVCNTSSTSSSCAVTTSPSNLNMTIGSSTKKISAVVSSGLGSATIKDITFGSYNETISTNDPKIEKLAPYETYASAISSGSTSIWATATLSDGRVCQSSSESDTDIIVQ